ncbi:xanthine dehydrogenase accessory factor [Cohnella sp. OV330]|uniref:XdhC family protein n=1 Tax=Cohnella sp. OV330 TaxID=1855288 RepID=UPI0008F20C86|nr:XdhC/CoxI family protein [Cohnella sp. OV330]SFB57730.1 xanthine dehydrogenase accessory factor [Cohnella sp. OV330]
MEACEIVEHWMTDAAPALLATVIGVEGHAYRKPGAMMLLYADGRKCGTISPGCLESDLLERTSGLLASGRSEMVRYNMKSEEDAVWGEAVGCGGIVDVLLEPLDGAAADAFRELGVLLRAGEGASLLRYRQGDGIVYEVRNLQAASVATLPRAVRSARLLFAQSIAPRPRLLLFGAGYDAEPVARIASALGFRVTVADWRPGLLSRERFPGVELLCGSPAEIAVSLGTGPADYALVMGHQLQRDRALIEALLSIKPAYVGVIGSSRRIAHLFDGLPMPPFVHAPVGLPIGAEGPEEIAISVAAELVAIRRKGKGGGADERVEHRGYLPGGRAERPDGQAEAVPGVCGW